MEIVIACLPFQLGHDAHGIFGSPIREHDDVFAVVLKRLWFRRVNNQRAVMTRLLLTGGVTVIPVGAVLSDGKTVGESFSRLDARETHARHAVHTGRQKQSVPMDGRIFHETIRDSQRRIAAFAQSHQRTRNGSIDGDGGASPVAELQLFFANQKVYRIRIRISDWSRFQTGVFKSVSRHDALQSRQQAECGGRPDEPATSECWECWLHNLRYLASAGVH